MIGCGSGALRARTGLSGTTRNACDGCISWTCLYRSHQYGLSHRLDFVKDAPKASSAKIEFFARGTFIALVDNDCIAGRTSASLHIVLF